jgi:hypothetical protein
MALQVVVFEELRRTMACFDKWMANSYPPWAAYQEVPGAKDGPIDFSISL